MIQVQSLTGMRPGEVVIMRGCDLDTSGQIWSYVPASHKTEHHGRRRIIYIGPRAQQIIKQFLKPDVSEYLFSPRDAMDEFQSKRRANRQTPMTPSQRRRRRKKNPLRSPSEHYTTQSYGYAILKACDKAGVPQWSPNQLRHNAATFLRKQYGIDVARVILGHSSPAVTEVYAELDRTKAIQVMAEVG